MNRTATGFKTDLNELAILGAPPAFDAPRHVGRPNIVGRGQIMRQFEAIFDRMWLTNDGQVLQQFEQRVAAYAQVEHCVATCNGTLALQLAARSLDLAGEVIVPSLTFVATPHALAWQGIRPVFADVDPRTWTLDADSVRAKITPRTTGILGVHLWGQVCDVAALAEVAAAHQLELMFDASHALGCAQDGVRVGNFGRAETLSFHATKFVNAAEGGAILTNDAKLADRLRTLRNFGFAEPGSVVEIGTNAKMSEFSAAIGLASLDHATEIVAINRNNEATYRLAIDRLPGLHIKAFNDPDPSNHQYVVMEVDARQIGLTRDELLMVLRAENVLARRYFFPGCHRLEAYSPDSQPSLPHTEAIVQRTITLPTGMAIDQTDILQIACILELALSDPDRVRAQLQGMSLESGSTAMGTTSHCGPPAPTAPAAKANLCVTRPFLAAPSATVDGR